MGDARMRKLLFQMKRLRATTKCCDEIHRQSSRPRPDIFAKVPRLSPCVLSHVRLSRGKSNHERAPLPGRRSIMPELRRLHGANSLLAAASRKLCERHHAQAALPSDNPVLFVEGSRITISDPMLSLALPAPGHSARRHGSFSPK